jgi:hypothetical protein
MPFGTAQLANALSAQAEVVVEAPGIVPLHDKYRQLSLFLYL